MFSLSKLHTLSFLVHLCVSSSSLSVYSWPNFLLFIFYLIPSLVRMEVSLNNKVEFCFTPWLQFQKQKEHFFKIYWESFSIDLFYQTFRWLKGIFIIFLFQVSRGSSLPYFFPLSQSFQLILNFNLKSLIETVVFHISTSYLQLSLFHPFSRPFASVKNVFMPL